MDAIISYLIDKLHQHWQGLVTAFVFSLVGWYLGKRRARAEWQKKEFLDRVNVSLNSIRDGELQIRTILEKSCAEIFLNSVAVETVTAAARSTTPENPILPLPKADYWHYLNAVLNEVSEKFATGLIERDMGKTVRSETYVLCLTREVAGEMRTHKIRAMLIRKQQLLNLPAEMPKLQKPDHSIRWRCLKLMATELTREPHKFLELEICL